MVKKTNSTVPAGDGRLVDRAGTRAGAARDDRRPRVAGVDRAGEAGARPLRLDDLDRRLLGLLQQDGRATSVELARRLALSPPGLQRRLRRLEAAGVIRGYTALVDRAAVGLDLLCFVEVKLAHHRPDCVARFRDAVQAIPEVLECHYLTGESDYLIKIVVPNHKALETVLFEGLMRIDGVDRIHTSIVVNEVKVSTALPLEAPPRSGGGER